MLKDYPTPESFFELLSDQFPAATRAQWREAAERLLKGKPFDQVLLTQTLENILLQPMYWPDDLQGLAHVDSYPGSAPFVRGRQAAGQVRKGWLVAQEIPEALPASFNAALQEALARGQTAAVLRFDEPTQSACDADAAGAGAVGREGISISSLADLDTALSGIALSEVAVVARCGASGLFVMALLSALCERYGARPGDLHGCAGADPLGELARTGQLPATLAQLYDEMAIVSRWAAGRAPHLQIVMIQGDIYHDAGANAVQELAFVLATGAEYVRALVTRGLPAGVAAGQISAAFAVGTNFFMEIAKLRAARMLWQQMVAAFGGEEITQRLSMHARTGRWNKTKYDPHINLLRTTVEAFAAVLGGCDSLHVGPFDEVTGNPGAFSQRLARNIQLILREESHVHRVIDPPGGSWYSEKLTAELAEKAWALFQEIEKKGGMAEALELGIPQQMVAETAQKRAERLVCGQDVLVGINQYANPAEAPPAAGRPDMDTLFRQRQKSLAKWRKQRDGQRVQTALEKVKTLRESDDAIAGLTDAAAAGATLGEMRAAMRGEGGEMTRAMPLKRHRGAEMYEKLRDAVGQYRQTHRKMPGVFLANFGSVGQFRARADFARGFFELAGLPVAESPALADTQSAVRAVLAADPAVVVICGSDEIYPERVVPFTRQIKQKNGAVQVVLAGHPGENEATYRAAGVDAFIHRRSNAYETLQRVLAKCGING